MTLDEIVTAYRTPMPPREALRAGVREVEGLAPLVYDRVERFCGGECLQPHDSNLVYFGLHVLAAARHEGLWPQLVSLARVPQVELEELFVSSADMGLTQLMLSAWPGDAAELMHLIEHADLPEASRTALFDTLTRLTFDGRIPREETAAFLARYERENLADEGDEAWLDWSLAVTRLGLVEMEPVLQRVWAKEIFEDVDDDFQSERLAELRHAAANPGDATEFDECGHHPIDDPGDAVAWLEESIAAMSAAAEAAGLPFPAPFEEEDDGDDPAAEMRLTPPQIDWLGRFLVSRQATPSTMPLVMVDGFLTALALGPAATAMKPEIFVPLIWSDNGGEPDWRGDQKAVVTDMLSRHWQGILARRQAGVLPRPLLADPDDIEGAAAWSDGFMYAMEVVADSWLPLTRDHRGSEDLFSISAMCGDDDQGDSPPASQHEIALTIERLPRILQRISQYWDNPAKGYRLGTPVKVQKVGRNDPCPCGSGKKYKKCCGLNPPQLH